LNSDEPATTADETSFEVSVSASNDDSRINISVFNVRANNIRAITSYRQAEALGDLNVSFVRGDKVFTSIAERYESPDEFLVEWLPLGSGVGWSLPDEFFIASFNLPKGCYTIEVSFSNQAAVKAPVQGHPGPVSAPAVASSRVCV
jgi:hypothetical protein